MKDILRAANAAIAAGDHEGFLAYCTDDTRWNFVGEQLLDGKDAVRRWMADAYKDGPPVVEIDDLIAEGDLLTAVGHVTTTDASGASTRAAYCDVWRFRDGKLAELRAFVISGARTTDR